MRILLGASVLALAASVLPASPAPADSERPRLRWHESYVDPGQSYRGVDVVDRRTVWLAGGSGLGEEYAGSIWRTTNGGRIWSGVRPVSRRPLMFRDVEARSARVAVALAIGPGAASRIYRTGNGGRTWKLAFRNPDPDAFYNCMDFYPGGKRGLAVSDPVDGRFRILRTSDGGRSWRVLSNAEMPDSAGEFNFAASGDCLVIKGRHAWFGSGGARSRIFHSADFGRTWEATDSTIPAGEAAGVFGLAFRTPRHGVAVGGSFETPGDADDGSALTRDGRRWRGGGDLHVLAEDAAWLRGRTVLAVGESGDVAGTQVSRDGGRSWTRLGSRGYHSMDCVPGICWAAGGDGRVARLRY